MNTSGLSVDGSRSTVTPLVSVIVPVYNAERFLKHCLDSIVGQTYQNLQIILVDDGSNDDSPNICDEYASHDKRIEVIHQANGGIAKAQNTGLDAAHGSYIAFADNDDILDAHNVELLLHTLLSTGADMSKARWHQFGVSQTNAIAMAAANGAREPKNITVFRNPLHAYQTVFCKSLRLLGNVLGRNSEALYFNEANWCRLYKAELWDGIRFPEGMYAQDVMVAGQLYSRMDVVADIDVNLYNWLQSSGSVTHSKRDSEFYHDNIVAGIANFKLSLESGVTPARSYYTILGSLYEERATYRKRSELSEQYHIDCSECKLLVHRLSLKQRVTCSFKRILRLLEKQVYDAHIKNMK